MTSVDFMKMNKHDDDDDDHDDDDDDDDDDDSTQNTSCHVPVDCSFSV